MTFNQEFVGPPLGSFLFAAFAALPFFVDAASFALAAAIVMTITGDFTTQRTERALVAGLGAEISEGLRWVWGQPVLRGIMIIAAVMNIVFFAAFSVRVLFATVHAVVAGWGELPLGSLVKLISAHQTFFRSHCGGRRTTVGCHSPTVLG